MAIRIGSSAAATQHVVALPGWVKTLRGWVLKTIGGVLVGMVTAVWTPVGDAIIERVHPTSAHVEGTVVQDGKPARGLIRLNGERADESNSVGLYVFDDVPKGSHDLLISQDGELVYDLDIHVAAKQETLTVPTIDLAIAAPMVTTSGGPTGETNPHYVPPAAGTPAAEAAASPAAAPTAGSTQGEGGEGDSPEVEATFEAGPRPAATPEATWEGNSNGEFSTAADRDTIALVVDLATDAEDQHATVWVDADYDVLSEVERVTYYLDPSFDPSAVTRYDSWDGFALTFPAPGSFDLIARVIFMDGTSVDLTVPIKG